MSIIVDIVEKSKLLDFSKMLCLLVFVFFSSEQYGAGSLSPVFGCLLLVVPNLMLLCQICVKIGMERGKSDAAHYCL